MEKEEHGGLYYVVLVMVTVVTMALAKEALLVTGEAGTAAQAAGGANGTQSFVVVIDPGHGGSDPGKITGSGLQEKDINLAVSEKLKKYLELSDVCVYMTRMADEDLSSRGGGSIKQQDMRARISLITETQPDLVISIHQNSYPSESVHGFQMFYYKGSGEGKTLATLLQQALRETLDRENKRQIKENDTYYLLKKSPVPTVIAECGFLTNSEEGRLLQTPEYQERLAWALHLGILQYLNGCGTAAEKGQ